MVWQYTVYVREVKTTNTNYSVSINTYKYLQWLFFVVPLYGTWPSFNFMPFLDGLLHGVKRWKIRMIESNAKCRYVKKLNMQRDFAAGVLSVWGPFPAYDPILPPPSTLYTSIQYTYSHEEGGELIREKVRGAIVHKAVRKYQHDWLYLLSINSIKHQSMVETMPYPISRPRLLSCILLQARALPLLPPSSGSLSLLAPS